MATKFSVNIGKIVQVTFIRRPDFKRFIWDDLATLCKHLVKFGQVIREFKRMKDVHLSSISSLATFALLLDLAAGDQY